MSQMGLQERTRQFLEEPLLDEQDLDTKVRLLLEAEYLRRLGQYRRLDRILTQKYGMTPLKKGHLTAEHTESAEIL